MAAQAHTAGDLRLKVADMSATIQALVTLARSMECELNDIIHQLGKGYESGRYMDGLVIALNMIEEKAVELESIAYPPKLEVVR